MDNLMLFFNYVRDNECTREDIIKKFEELFDCKHVNINNSNSFYSENIDYWYIKNSDGMFLKVSNVPGDIRAGHVYSESGRLNVILCVPLADKNITIIDDGIKAVNPDLIHVNDILVRNFDKNTILNALDSSLGSEYDFFKSIKNENKHYFYDYDITKKIYDNLYGRSYNIAAMIKEEIDFGSFGGEGIEEEDKNDILISFIDEFISDKQMHDNLMNLYTLDNLDEKRKNIEHIQKEIDPIEMNQLLKKCENYINKYYIFEHTNFICTHVRDVFLKKIDNKISSYKNEIDNLQKILNFFRYNKLKNNINHLMYVREVFDKSFEMIKSDGFKNIGLEDFEEFQIEQYDEYLYFYENYPDMAEILGQTEYLKDMHNFMNEYGDTISKISDKYLNHISKPIDDKTLNKVYNELSYFLNMTFPNNDHLSYELKICINNYIDRMHDKLIQLQQQVERAINYKEKEDLDTNSSIYKDNEHEQDGIYTVEITETLQYQEEIKARNKEEAEKILKEKYDNCEIVLDENNHVATDFKIINCKKEIEETIDEKEQEYDIEI